MRGMMTVFDTPGFRRKLLVRVAPLSVLDLYGAIIPVGVEYNLGQNWSVIGEVGVPLFAYYFYTENTAYTKIKSDIKLRGEIRNYINFYNEVQANETLFLGMEFFYRQQAFLPNGENAYYKTIDSKITRYYFKDGATVTKQIWGAGILIGGTSNCGKRVVLETYLGLGIQSQSAAHNNVKIIKVQNDRSMAYESLNQNHLDGMNIKPYIPFGVKAAYSLYKK